jgi:hypothetical protein
LHLFGGLVLNTAIGGFNVEAVDIAIQMGAKQIWMPTRSAAQEYRYTGRAGHGLSIEDEHGRLLPEVREILRLAGDADIVLGTGHLSSRETVLLIREGRNMGLRKILVNHPEIEFVDLSERLQLELRGPGVFFERCYVRKGFRLDWNALAESVRRVGYEYSVFATDLGQPDNPDPVSGLAEMFVQFAGRGFGVEELRVMMRENPAFLLGL